MNRAIEGQNLDEEERNENSIDVVTRERLKRIFHV